MNVALYYPTVLSFTSARAAKPLLVSKKKGEGEIMPTVKRSNGPNYVVIDSRLFRFLFSLGGLIVISIITSNQKQKILIPGGSK